MARCTELVKERNRAILKEFNRLEGKYPRWRYEAYLKALSERFWLAPTTISKILNK